MGVLNDFRSHNRLDDSDYIPPLPPVEQAVALSNLVEEAKDKNLNDTIKSNFYFIYRRQEEALERDNVFQSRLAKETQKFRDRKLKNLPDPYEVDSDTLSQSSDGEILDYLLTKED